MVKRIQAKKEKVMQVVFMERLEKMRTRKYSMRMRRQKIKMKKAWILDRLKQKDECKSLRLNFVAGLLSKFYNKWYSTKYAFRKTSGCQGPFVIKKARTNEGT